MEQIQQLYLKYKIFGFKQIMKNDQKSFRKYYLTFYNYEKIWVQLNNIQKKIIPHKNKEITAHKMNSPQNFYLIF